MSFFFTKRQATKFADINILKRLECKICPLYNLSINKHKDILPQGPITEGGIYLLGRSPNKEEDYEGKFFIGRSGEMVRENFSTEQWKKVRLNNITRTRTPKDEDPTYESIECCRPSIERDIALVKPKIILGFGEEVLQWVLPINHDNKKASIMAWRGHPFPITIAGHTCWYYPIYSGDYVIEHPFLEHVFKLDIANALKFADRNKPPVVEDLSKVRNGTEILTDLLSIRAAFEKLKTLPYAVGDLETHQARPYYADSRILTQAWGNYEWSFAFPWKHPEATWTTKEFAELRSIVYNFLIYPIKKVAHNTAFELEWFIDEFGIDIIKGPLRELWEDTQCAAYILGYGGSEKRSGGGGEFEEVSRVQRGLLALGNLTQAYLGFFLKSQSKVDRAKLIKDTLVNVLKYNILDPKYTAKVYDLLMQDIDYNNLKSVYKEQCRRVATAVLTQRKGLAYNPEQAVVYLKEYTDKLTLKAEETMRHSAVIEYQTKFGGFNITTPGDVAGLFKYLGFKTEDKEGKSKSGKDILSLIDHPLARNIETIRETGKVISTYIEPFTTKEIIFPDNKLHTQFTTMFTTTGRLSSLDPNIQNFPKRANKQIRKVIVAPPNHKLCTNDYGQIEARVLAMASKDPEFCKALWTGFDIHSYWALILAQSYPKRVGGEKIVQKWTDANIETLKDTDKLFKGFRDIVKNKWVFPAFFGASTKSLAGYMGIPYDNAETVQKKFWKTYHVIHDWQKTMYEFYAKHGYIESLTGHRRYMYMQGGEIINHPIQGTAAAIVMDGMNRLSEYATETGKMQFQAVMQIHDDLGFYLPDETWEEDHKFIVKEMLSCKFPFINVPLTVESAIGTNWYELKEIGTYSSDKLAA
jgi:uracil-DNA glycosylase family 4